jgi:hypothetical protein
MYGHRNRPCTPLERSARPPKPSTPVNRSHAPDTRLGAPATRPCAMHHAIAPSDHSIARRSRPSALHSCCTALRRRRTAPDSHRAGRRRRRGMPRARHGAQDGRRTTPRRRRAALDERGSRPNEWSYVPGGRAARVRGASTATNRQHGAPAGRSTAMAPRPTTQKKEADRARDHVAVAPARRGFLEEHADTLAVS